MNKKRILTGDRPAPLRPFDLAQDFEGQAGGFT